MNIYEVVYYVNGKRFAEEVWADSSADARGCFIGSVDAIVGCKLVGTTAEGRR